jgi:hypothetical protein
MPDILALAHLDECVLLPFRARLKGSLALLRFGAPGSVRQRR